MDIQITDPTLKKDFKIFSYKIQAYGEQGAKLSIYVSNDLEYDIKENGFYTLDDNHYIEPSNLIYNFLSEYIREHLDDTSDYDRYYDVEIIFDTKTNSLDYKFWRTYSAEDRSTSEFNFDDLSDKFVKALKKFKDFKEIKITYDGGGDSGWVDQVLRGKNKRYELNVRKNQDDNIILEELYKILSDNYGSWGNDDGCTGNITIDFKTKMLFINHTEYYESTEVMKNFNIKLIL